MADFRAYENIIIGVNGSVPDGSSLLGRFNEFLSTTFDFRLAPDPAADDFTSGTAVDITPVLGGVLPTPTITPPFTGYAGTDDDQNLYLADDDTGTVSANELEQWRQDLNKFIEEYNSDNTENIATFDDSLTGLDGIITNPLTTVFYDGSPPTSTNPTSTGDLPVCFAAGTMITTPDGERAVETLAPGDAILTADGRTVAVKWIGRQTVHRLFTAEDRFRPVKVAAGALAPGVPHTDLVLTADHGLLVGGIIANAGALVNGRSIFRVPAAELADTVIYYHVETDEHDLILANGAPAETFVDNVTRRRFDNYDEYEALFGASPDPMSELPLPRAMSRRQLPVHVHTALTERAAILGNAAAAAA